MENLNPNYESTKNYVSQLNQIVTAHGEAWQKVPSYAEYNSNVQKDLRQKSENKLLDKFTSECNSLHNSAQVDINKITENIYKKKYPLISTRMLVEDKERLRGAVEYQTAIQYLTFIAPRYPIEEIKNAYSYSNTATTRWDYLSSLIDIAMALPTATKEGSLIKEKGEFIREVNLIWKGMGILDLMKERLELEWLQSEIRVKFEAIAGADRILQGHGLQWAVSSMLSSNAYQTALAELSI
jgi:hypothetical protein